jgi:hypothetical protein
MVTTGLAMLALVSLIWRKQIWEVGAQANHL